MRRIFTRLRDLLNPRTPGPSEPLRLPYNISEGELHSLADMRSHPGYEVFTSALDTLSNLYGDALLAPSSRDAAFLHETRGTVLGIRRSASLVDEILAKAKEVQSHNARLANLDSAAAARLRANAALFGTPGWPGAS